MRANKFVKFVYAKKTEQNVQRYFSQDCNFNRQAISEFPLRLTVLLSVIPTQILKATKSECACYGFTAVKLITQHVLWIFITNIFMYLQVCCFVAGWRRLWTFLYNKYNLLMTEFTFMRTPVKMDAKLSHACLCRAASYGALCRCNKTAIVSLYTLYEMFTLTHFDVAVARCTSRKSSQGTLGRYETNIDPAIGKWGNDGITMKFTPFLLHSVPGGKTTMPEQRQRRLPSLRGSLL